MSAVPATGENLELCRQRQERVHKALNYEPVDKIPYTYLGPAFAPASQGQPLSRFCTDADFAIDVTLDAMDAVGNVDACNAMVAGLFPVLLANQWLSRIDIPGRQLPDDVIWQVHEKREMTVEDYDIVIDQGWDAFLEYMTPKIHQLDLLEQHNAWLAENLADAPRRYYERGYPILASAVAQPALESVCGARSMAEFYLDLYRRPDVVEAALDVVNPWWIELAKTVTGITGVKCTWVVGQRGASQMMPPKLWERFSWPYTLEMVTQLHEAGIFCVLHYDSNHDREIPYLLDLPRRSAALALDGSTDIRAAKEQLGDHLAFIGDVPASLLAVGTPDDVYKYVSDLIRDIGPTGLLINSGCDIPYTAPLENVQAMAAATLDAGSATAG